MCKNLFLYAFIVDSDEVGMSYVHEVQIHRPHVALNRRTVRLYDSNDGLKLRPSIISSFYLIQLQSLMLRRALQLT